MFNPIIIFLQFLGGLLALIGGATIFVDGASGLARRLRIPPVVIGLTVVALGTSAPEIGVNVVAAMSGQPALAVGNVVGSNILNILGVLGLSALLAPLVVTQQVVRVDVPVMFGSALLFWIFALDLHVNAFEAAILLGILGVYTAVQLINARRFRQDTTILESEPDSASLAPERPLALQFGAIVGGAILLLLGSNWLVSGASSVAKALNVEDRVIGLTVVAIGTSLPELAASLTATLRGERDLAVGNVVGSNIYNVLAVVGLTGTLSSSGISVPPGALDLDFPVMLVASLACLPIFIVGFRIERWEGAVFSGYYLLYLAYLIFEASDWPFAHVIAAIGPIALVITTVVAALHWLKTLRGRPYGDASIRS